MGKKGKWHEKLRELQFEPTRLQNQVIAAGLMVLVIF